ncbi:MAG: ABC transporter ATP-binding protein [Burkholderiaceae bacterium]
MVADNISIVFSDPESGARHVAVDNVSLKVAAGEFLVLVGRSGCGKTTLLNAIAGLVAPTAGTLSVLGGEPRAVRRDIGYMFARDAMIPWRNARRNVEFGLEIRGVGKAERREAALRMLERVNLRSAANKLPWQLSQGMRQRVALARTWVAHPRLLLMDEPFAALDAQTKAEVRQQFLSLWEAEPGNRGLFVTHDITEALLMADRIVLVKDGGRFDLVVETGFERPRHARDLVHSERFRALEIELTDRLH